jgi:SAM-dependent methyltransferase
MSSVTETIDTSAQEWITGTGDRTISLYERDLVPAIFEPFARRLVAAAALRSHDRILDIGCGTGVVARVAASRAGALGRVVGVDVAPRFLAVAREVASGQAIEWIEADAQDLSIFPAGSFDVVLCQQAFQFLPDRFAAAAEMHRVLSSGGCALVSVWTALEETPGHLALEVAIEKHLGAVAAAPMRGAIFALQDPHALAACLRDGGFDEVSIERHEIAISYPSAEDFARGFAETMLEDVPGEAIDRVVADTAAALQPRARPDGAVALRMTANVAVARAR